MARRATIAAEDEGLIIEQAPPREAAAASQQSKPVRTASIKPRQNWQGKKGGKRKG